MPIKENSVDVVWSQGLIEHFENPLKIVTEHYRICQSGGVVLISTPAKYSYQHLWYKITRPKMLRKFWPWTEQEFYNKKKYRPVKEYIAQSRGSGISNEQIKARLVTRGWDPRKVDSLLK